SRYYAATAAKLLARRNPRGVLPVLTDVQVRHRPKGVVAVISPWNYPLALAVSDALPALVAGNAVVGRPDNQTALTALWAADAAARSGEHTSELQSREKLVCRLLLDYKGV